MAAKNTAPGPDGVSSRVLALAISALGERLRGYFNELLSLGWFPQAWKEGLLVLLRKDGRPADSPSAFRPIVLLDEAGKLFERVLAARLDAHMEQVGPNLSDSLDSAEAVRRSMRSFASRPPRRSRSETAGC